MKNPLAALPMMNPAVPEGTFRRGFTKGLGSGALMMGIFSTLGGISSMVIGFGTPFGWGMLGMMALGSVATGLFTGITATQRAAESASSARNASHDAQRAPIRAPEHGVAPALAHADHNSRAWQDKVSQNRPNGHERVNKILADRNLDDQGRAAAILKEREQSTTLNASR